MTKMPVNTSTIVGAGALSKKKLKYVKKTSKVLARKLFHSMILHGPKLDKQQLLLGSLAEIGTELFIITASSNG